MPTDTPAVPAPAPLFAPLHRQPLYLGGAREGLFAFLHTDDAVPARDCIAVICPPFGYEYVHSHRSMRHLADALARQGVQALRFDYHGVGDSPGSDLDPDRLERWLGDVRLALDEARRLSGGAPVCLVGVRLGATMAALVAAQVEVDWLVLWNACPSGRGYVREQQAVAMQALPAGAQRDPAAPLEAAGFMLTPQTQESLKAVKLSATAFRARRGALLVQRDDLGADDGLAAQLAAQGVRTDVVACPGFNEMMAEPLWSQVPRAAIDATVHWLVRDSALRATPPVVTPLADETRFAFTADDGTQAELTDTACRLGVDGHLFGIHTRPSQARDDLPTVVMFSSGVVHRMGPNRLYTWLARNLAAAGFDCFRCDIEGVGDSVLRTAGRENHPYPDNALEDAEQVLEFLRQRFGARRFIVMGLCSGAYTSFLAGVSESAYPIGEVLLVNPLTFQWVDGDTLDTEHFREVAHYKGSMRSSNSWKKLLRGQVNVLKVGRVVCSHLATQLVSHLQALLERVYPKAGTVLANRLRRMFARGRHVSLFVASGDPGWDMITAGARQAVYRGLHRGDLSVQFIADADHTFSGEAARRRLLASLRTHLGARYPAAADIGRAAG